MAAGPGAEFGILVERARISAKEKRPEGTSGGAGMEAYESETSSNKADWSVARADERGSGVGRETKKDLGIETISDREGWGGWATQAQRPGTEHGARPPPSR